MCHPRRLFFATLDLTVTLGQEDLQRPRVGSPYRRRNILRTGKGMGYVVGGDWEGMETDDVLLLEGCEIHRRDWD